MNYITFLYVLIGLLGFGFLVIIHEFGHFVVAKINGVKVLEFAIGMGPKLFSINSKETTYSLRAFPIGGYVRMLGEEEKSSDPRSFTNLTPPRRLSIVAAGPLMNFITAILFFAIIKFSVGYVVPIISNVETGSPAEAASIIKGDKLISINGNKISKWDDFVIGVSNSKGKEVAITVERNNKEINVNVVPKFDKEENRYKIGAAGTVEKPSFLKAISFGISDTNNIINETFKFFKTLFTGKADMSQVGGPISILRISAKAAEAGFLNLIYLLAVISVQLAVFNVIPFPALDGGFIFLFLFEIITGKRVDDSKVSTINYFGFIFLMILMVLVVFKDIFYPIKL